MMVTRVEFTISADSIGPKRSLNGRYVTYEDYEKLEAENARLRQQRYAANAQLDFYSGEYEMRYSIGAKCFIAGLIIAGFVTAYALYRAL